MNTPAKPATPDPARTFTFLGLFILLGAAVLVGLAFKAQRNKTQKQILSRDAHLIAAVAELETQRLRGKANAYFDALDFALAASDLEGIIGLTLFDKDGQPIAAVPESIILPSAPLESTPRSASAHWHPGFPMHSLFLDEKTNDHHPLIEVRVPLPDIDGEEHTTAVYWIDGSSAELEFGALDRDLTRRASLVMAGFIILISILLGFGHRQISRSKALHSDYRDALRQANADLILAAKTTVVGSLSINFLHGLRRPVAHLQNLLADIPDAADARATANRIHALLDHTANFLRDDISNGQVSYTASEILDELVRRHRQTAATRGITLETRTNASEGAEQIPAHDARLALVILSQLLEKSIHYICAGGRIDVEAGFGMWGWSFSVSDNGPGIPVTLRNSLFQIAAPEDGTNGLGLAISRQIARHMGGELDLIQSNAGGSTFSLRFPSARSRAKTAASAEQQEAEPAVETGKLAAV